MTTTTTYTIVTRHTDGGIGLHTVPRGKRPGRRLCQRTHLRGGKTTLTAWIAHEPGLPEKSIVKQAQDMWRRMFGEGDAVRPAHPLRPDVCVTPDLERHRREFWGGHTPPSVRRQIWRREFVASIRAQEEAEAQEVAA